MKRRLNAMLLGKICAIAAFLWISLGTASAAQELVPVTPSDIIAGMAQREDGLAEYRCRDTVTHRALYKPIYDDTELRLNEAYRIVRYATVTPEEIAAYQEVRTYSYVAKGLKFAFEEKVESANPMRKPSERCYTEMDAFDGERHLTFSNYGGQDFGAVLLPKAWHDGLSPMDYRPEHFFRYCENAPVKEALKAEPVVVRPGTEKVLGKDCYVVDCAIKDGVPKFTFYFCPEYGFTPLRMVRTFGVGKDTYTKYEVTEVVEAADGVWFPVRATRESYHNNPENKAESLMTYSVEYQLDLASLRVNTGDVRDDEFTFDFPVGTFVHDEFTGREYRVGEAAPGDAVDRMLDNLEDAGEGGDAEAMASTGEGVVQSAAGAGTATAEAPVGDTRGAGRGWLQWVIVVTGAAAGAVVLLRRKGRA